MYVLETSRLGLRNWQDSDLPVFAEMNRDVRVMEFFPGLLSEEESRGIIERSVNRINDEGFGFWATELKDTREFIGFVGLSVPRFQAHFTPCVEIGWRLAHRYWGKGYATEAALECLRYGFDMLGLEEILSFTSVLNTRSVNVMQKIGMEYHSEFDHPQIEEGNKLRKHVVYAKKRND